MNSNFQWTKEVCMANNVLEKYKSIGWPVHLFTGDDFFAIFKPQELAFTVPWNSPYIQLNYFVFTFIKDARGHYIVDDHTYLFGPSTFYFTNPGHHSSIWFDELAEAWIIAVNEGFLKEYAHAGVFEEFNFLFAETYPGIELSVKTCAEVEELFTQIFREYSSDALYRNRLLANLFIVMLLKLKEQFGFSDHGKTNISRGDEIVKRFKRLLAKHYRDMGEGDGVKQLFRVQDYAAALNLHPGYLNSLVKSKTGKAITTWIAEKNIAEAKFLLINSNLTVSEICYRLGFSKPSHFNNHFKKHTSLSPGAYRKTMSKG